MGLFGDKDAGKAAVQRVVGGFVAMSIADAQAEVIRAVGPVPKPKLKDNLFLAKQDASGLAFAWGRFGTEFWRVGVVFEEAPGGTRIEARVLKWDKGQIRFLGDQISPVLDAIQGICAK